MNLGDYIKEYRTKNKLSQDDFASRLKMSKAYISILERNYNPSTGKAAVPSLETIRRVAMATAVDFNDLLDMLDEDQEVSLGDDSKGFQLPVGTFPIPTFNKKPRLGTIACGKPILAVEDAEEYDDVPEEIDCDFTLKCQGDSMINARIFDGDIVYIRQQDMVENGEIAAVLIDDEATLKRIHLFDDHIILSPENPTHKPYTYWNEDMNNVRILGKAVAFTSRIY